MMLRLLVIGVCLLGATTSERLRYDGHKVLRVFPKGLSDVEFLRDFQEKNLLNLDFWSRPNLGEVDIHVRPEVEASLSSILKGRGFRYDVIIDNLQQLVDEETRSNEEARQQAGKSIVGTFATPDEISAWMKSVASSSPLATLVNIGKSYEGRNVDLIKVSSGGSNKQGIVIDSGIHAREWLSQATLVWMINEMVTKYDTDADIKAMVDKYDWYLLPMVNPDGYAYSHDYDRMWRKTRSKNNHPYCLGADANRNFDYPVFGGASTSSNPCSNIYKGSSAFSEVEALNLKNFFNSKKGQIKMYVAIHAYSQMWFTPWSFDGNIRPNDAAEMDRVANIGADALYKVHRTRFEVGTAPDILYATAGAAEDWAKGYGGVTYAYCFELRPGPNSSDGFVVKASEIQPSGEEVLAGLLAAAAAMK